MEVMTLAALAALVVKIMSVIKSIGKDNNKVITQVLTWVVGCLVVFLAAHSSVTSNLVFADQPLGLLDIGSQVFVGLSLSSGGSLLYDFKKAIDSSDSASEPNLIASAPVSPAS